MVLTTYHGTGCSSLSSFTKKMSCKKCLLIAMHIQESYCWNLNKDFQLTFGKYLEIYDQTDNIPKGRTTPGTALQLCAKVTSSWEMMNIVTHQ